MKLFEHLQQILLEYDHNITVNKFGEKVKEKAKKDQTARMFRSEDNSIDADSIIQRIEQADPTAHKEYTQWLVRTYVNTDIKLEDIVSTTADALADFAKLKVKKALPPEYRDINRIKTSVELEQIVADLADKLRDVEEVAKGQSKQIYNGKTVRVVELFDTEAACYYGQGTRWCTSARNNNMFNAYIKDGPMFVVIPKQPRHVGEKYQLHPASKQCKDETDITYKFSKLITDYPELYDALRGIPAFQDIPALQDKETFERRAQEKAEQERQRQKAMEDFIASLSTQKSS